mmetsp:Transcript_42440/g.104009  ORF Transcript_42440/g.104009 Transcript_42440/m.104009 type:complete len:333 (+) Transcript_42440:50-1048(+)
MAVGPKWPWAKHSHKRAHTHKWPWAKMAKLEPLGPWASVHAVGGAVHLVSAIHAVDVLLVHAVGVAVHPILGLLTALPAGLCGLLRDEQALLAPLSHDPGGLHGLLPRELARHRHLLAVDHRDPLARVQRCLLCPLRLRHHCARAVAHKVRLEAACRSILRGPPDAEVEGKAAHIHLRDSRLDQDSAHGRLPPPAVVEEAAVRVNLSAQPLAHDHVALVQVQLRVELRPVAALHAVPRPHDLLAEGAVGQLEGLHVHHLDALVVVPEGAVVRGVPVTCVRDHVELEHLAQQVGPRDGLLPLRHRKRARHKVILQIDNEEGRLPPQGRVPKLE